MCKTIVSWLCVLTLVAACGDDDTVANDTPDDDDAVEEGSGGQQGDTSPDGPQPAPGCDPDIPAGATCGGETCEVLGNLRGAPLCTVPCCAELNGNQVCGSRSASLDSPTECTAGPTFDESCPIFDPETVDGSVPFADEVLPGCCTADGVCGVWVSFRSSCLTESQFISLPENPQSCGPNAGDDVGEGEDNDDDGAGDGEGINEGDASTGSAAADAGAGD